MLFEQRLIGLLTVTLAVSTGCKAKTDEAPPTPEPTNVEAKTADPADEASDAKSTEEVLDHHLKAFGEANMDEILADYTDDAVFITQMGTLRGKDQLKAAFEGLFAEFAKPGLKFAIDKKMVQGEIGYITWSGETADNVYDLATDTFVVVDGKITAQTFAGKITPKNPPAKDTADAADEPPAAGPTQAVLAHHLDSFGKRNIEELMKDYGAESAFVSQMGQLVGADKLKPVFEGLFTEFGKPGMSFKMDKMVVEGEVAFIVWSAETADNTYEWATDTLVVRDGKIAYQTLAAKVTPKG